MIGAFIVPAAQKDLRQFARLLLENCWKGLILLGEAAVPAAPSGVSATTTVPWRGP
jgi:hypothetical protein